jgi:hypothetical protein
MPIKCPQCSSDNLLLDERAPDGPGIATLCRDCSHLWRREPASSCLRCASLDVEDVGINEAWAYDDLDASGDDAGKSNWSYIDKVNHTCCSCHHSWYTVHTSSPYQPTAEDELTRPDVG